MTHTMVILNPTSGDGSGADAVREWVAGRPDTELRATDAPGDAERFTREAVEGGARLIVAAGGDGTVSGVVNGLAADFGAARLAIVPLGTGNDFCRTAGLTCEPPDALAFIEAGRTRRIDIVRVTHSDGTRYLLNAATGGFSHVVWKHMTARSKSWLGPLAYVVAAVQSFGEIPWIKTNLIIDDDRLSAKTFTIVIGNGQYVAGGHRVAPVASIDDGKLDVSIITAETFPQRIGLLLRFWVGLYLFSPHVIFRQARRIEVEASPPMKFMSDGEPVGPTPMTFEVLPRVLELIVPENT